MKKAVQVHSRRNFLSQVGYGTAALAASPFFCVPGAFADEIVHTPYLTVGPFYPEKLPLDTDNDLLLINDSINPSVGEITHLTGRILDASGNPLRNIVIEIWQCDANGIYIREGAGNPAKKAVQDNNFQGFGRFLTSSTGEYYFRTIKPVPYGGRAPHIHVMIKKGDKELLTTQCFVKGHPDNPEDYYFHNLGETKERDSVTVDFAPIKESKIGELAAKFDVVLDVTPADRHPS